MLPSLLADESFQSKVKTDMRSTGETSENLKAIFGNILQESINILRTLDQNRLGKSLFSHVDFISLQQPDRSSCARAVTQLLNLLPFDQLIEAVEPLLDNEDQEVSTILTAQTKPIPNLLSFVAVLSKHWRDASVQARR